MKRRISRFIRKAGKHLAIAGTYLAANWAQCLDSNWYFQTTPIDMDPNATGIQWLRGSAYSNQFDVLLTVGADMPSNIRISAISFKMSDFDFTNSNYSFVSANLPDSGDTRDIFFGKIMAYNELYTDTSPNNRMIETLEDTRVNATNFISTPGLYGTWYESISDNVALGTLTNVAKSISSIAITVDNGVTSYNIPVAQRMRLPTPEYQLVDSLSVPEPGPANLGIGGAATIWAFRARRKKMRCADHTVHAPR